MTQDFTPFIERRQTLFDQLPDHSVAFVAAGEEQIRNRDVEYPFRPSSDFFYLTGFTEPDSVLVLLKFGELRQVHLFLRPKDEAQEIWQGRRLGVDAAASFLKIDQAWSIDDFEEQMNELVEGAVHLVFSFAELAHWSDWVSGWIGAQKAKARKGVQAPSRLQDLDTILHEMRLFKSAREIEWMRDAAQISVAGHLAAMKATAPGRYEYQVQAELENGFKQAGSPRVGFNSIVASGENACILHYTENDARIEEGQLVLIDAGAEYAGYAGDITHTFPANGRFTPPQAELYNLVLKAQQSVIDAICPGVPYNRLHEISVEVLTEGLLALGILTGTVDDLIEQEAYKAFFMHGTGHWLGMDVHDVGDYKQDGEWRCLQPGMVLTVEPGLYISETAESVPDAYRGIGIRIEDDVVVTEQGHEVLTQGLPRTVAEIEAWMAQR